MQYKQRYLWNSKSEIQISLDPLYGRKGEAIYNDMVNSILKIMLKKKTPLTYFVVSEGNKTFYTQKIFKSSRITV